MLIRFASLFKIWEAILAIQIESMDEKTELILSEGNCSSDMA